MPTVGTRDYCEDRSLRSKGPYKCSTLDAGLLRVAASREILQAVQARRFALSYSVERRPELSPPDEYSPFGGADEILDWLCREAQIVPIFNGTERAEGDLDPLLVVPADVRVQSLSELLIAR